MQQIVRCKDLPHQDLKEEVELTLELLKSLHQPGPPLLQVKGHTEVQADWDEVTLKSGLEVTYRLYNGGYCQTSCDMKIVIWRW